MEEWAERHPRELPGIVVNNRSPENPDGALEINYERGKKYRRRGNADLGITTDSSPFGNELEWIIEFKKIEFVGDIGGKSPHQEVAIAKMFSPFLSHTKGVLHDVDRINKHHLGKRKAVIVYAFSLDQGIVDNANSHPRKREEIHPEKTIDRSEQYRKLMKSAKNQPFCLGPMLTPFETMCEERGYELGERVHYQFRGLETHPVYVQGDFVAWEVFDNGDTISSNTTIFDY